MSLLKILVKISTKFCGQNFEIILAFNTQKAPDVPEDKKILKPCDYDMMLDHYPGDQKTMVSKSKSMVPPF